MMPILVKSDDVRSGRNAKARYGRRRSQWVKQEIWAGNEVSPRKQVLCGNQSEEAFLQLKLEAFLSDNFF